MKGNTTVAERISMLIEHFTQGNKTAFGRAAGLQSGLLAGIIGGRQSKPSFEVLQKILAAYPSVSPDWVLFGTGPMLRGQAPPPAPLAVELILILQEYMQVSKQLEGKKATHRELTNDLARLHIEVQQGEETLRVYLEQLPKFSKEEHVVMQKLIDQRQQTTSNARERYTAFLPLQEKAEQELIMLLNYQSKLEKRLGEFISSAVPLTAEEQMNALALRQQLAQAVSNPAV